MGRSQAVGKRKPELRTRQMPVRQRDRSTIRAAGPLAIQCGALEILKPVLASNFLISGSARPGDEVVKPLEHPSTRYVRPYKAGLGRGVFEHSRLDPDYLFALKQLNAQQKQQFAAEG